VGAAVVTVVGFVAMVVIMDDEVDGARVEDAVETGDVEAC